MHAAAALQDICSGPQTAGQTAPDAGLESKVGEVPLYAGMEVDVEFTSLGQQAGVHTSEAMQDICSGTQIERAIKLPEWGRWIASLHWHGGGR